MRDQRSFDPFPQWSSPSRFDLFSQKVRRDALHEIAHLIGLPDKDFPKLGQAYGSVVSGKGAYHSFFIPKKSGGKREITAPSRSLKFVQQAILHGFLKPRYKPTDICHSHVARQYGWIPGRTIVSNALAHLGMLPDDIDPDDRDLTDCRVPRVFFGVDVEKAYPSIDEYRVFEVFDELVDGSWASKVILTWLSTWNGCLPQGAPTSGLLLNFVFRELDAGLQEMFCDDDVLLATRYVDDIALTSIESDISAQTQQKLIDLVQSLGFKINMAKNCYWKAGQHALRITGINLYPEDDRIALPPNVVERFRARLFGTTMALQNSGIELRECLAEAGNDPTYLNQFKKMQRKRIGSICGMLGFCHMVYGNDLPMRPLNWHPNLKDPGALVQDVVALLTRVPNERGIYEAADMARGY